MRYKLIIWDVDGTLLNTGAGVIAAVRDTLLEAGYEVPDEKELRTFVGPPVYNSFIRHLGIGEEEASCLTTEFRLKYSMDKYLFNASVYPGILTALEMLRKEGIRMAIATYKREDYARRIVEHFGLMEYCDICYGADTDNKLTKADIIQKAVDYFDEILLENVVMIGDTEHDLKGAEALGLNFIGVSFGYGFEQGMHQMGKYWIAANVDEMMRLLHG